MRPAQARALTTVTYSAAEAKRLQAAAQTETEFQCELVKEAKALGWLVMHARTALRQSGKWSTPIQGHAGYPDLTLVKAGLSPVWAELKDMRGRLRPDQRRWRDEILGAGGRWFLWRPDCWDEIWEVLRETPRMKVGSDA